MVLQEKCSKNNIVYMTNESYLYQTYVSMYSLKENKHRGVNYDVYLLCIEFSNIGDIQSLQSDDFNIIPIFIDKNIFKSDNNAGVVYYKLLLHELLDVDTVFHIDSDTVVVDDISDIFNVNIDNKYCACVRDKINGLMYFNAGNLYLNLKYIRNQIIDGKYTMYTHFHHLDKKLNDNKGYLWEQDILNEAFNKNVEYINYGYNFLANTYSQYKFSEWVRVYGERLKSENIKIIHFASHPKPWVKLNLFGQIWKMYADKNVNKELENKILRLACHER